MDILTGPQLRFDCACPVQAGGCAVQVPPLRCSRQRPSRPPGCPHRRQPVAPLPSPVHHWHPRHGCPNRGFPCPLRCRPRPRRCLPAQRPPPSSASLAAPLRGQHRRSSALVSVLPPPLAQRRRPEPKPQRPQTVLRPRRRSPRVPTLVRHLSRLRRLGRGQQRSRGRWSQRSWGKAHEGGLGLFPKERALA